jgi:hypothetical protein
MATSDLTDESQHSALTPAHNRARWSIAFLLGLGVLINFFDRVNLSVAHDALRSTVIANILHRVRRRLLRGR